jgi:hypothetical protein
MQKIKNILSESKKKDSEEKVVFVETDNVSPFPEDCINFLKKRINKLSKDLSIRWNSPVELVNKSFEELSVPVPKAFQSRRFAQYTNLFGYAIEQLRSARGFSNEWFNG